MYAAANLIAAVRAVARPGEKLYGQWFSRCSYVDVRLDKKISCQSPVLSENHPWEMNDVQLERQEATGKIDRVYGGIAC
ncbi:hypothetical protein D3C75_1120070 [compost metagenome]